MGTGSREPRQDDENAKEKKSKQISQLPTLKYLEENETLTNVHAHTETPKDCFVVGSSKLISLFVCPSLHFIQKEMV